MKVNISSIYIHTYFENTLQTWLIAKLFINYEIQCHFYCCRLPPTRNLYQVLMPLKPIKVKVSCISKVNVTLKKIILTKTKPSKNHITVLNTSSSVKYDLIFHKTLRPVWHTLLCFQTAAAQRAGAPWCPLSHSLGVSPLHLQCLLWPPPTHLCPLQVSLSCSSQLLSSLATPQGLLQKNSLVFLGPGRTARQGTTAPAPLNVCR